MTRALWLFANMLLVFVALGAGWFAINAPQIARPVLTPLGNVELTPEAPPAPPGPLLMTTNDVVEVLNKRPLFTRPESPDAPQTPSVLALDGAAVVETTELEATVLVPDGDAALDGAPLRDVRAESPIARTMLDSLPAPLKNAPKIGEERRAPVDNLSAALSTPSPEVKQFFSWRSMNYNARDSDEQPPASVSPGLATPSTVAMAPAAVEAAPSPGSADEPPVEATDAPVEEPAPAIENSEPEGPKLASDAASLPPLDSASTDTDARSSEEVAELAVAEAPDLGSEVREQDVSEQDVSEIAASIETVTTAPVETEAETQEAAAPSDASSGEPEQAETLVDTVGANEAEEAEGPPPPPQAPEISERPTQRSTVPPARRVASTGSSIYSAFDETVSLAGEDEMPVDELGTARGEEVADFGNLSAPRPSARPSAEQIATRRVEMAATTLVDPAAPPEGGMILLGVFNGRGNERALVRTTSGSQRVVVGDEIDGWRVTAITDSAVQLRRSTSVRMLRMP
ncbi:MAG: hypothetical protein KTR21_15140 [Rhodobacteraceae bacterium]|nr:hypothetical protein [Paracoccaceae bacterium]